MNKPKSNKILYIIIVILLLFVFAGFFGGNNYLLKPLENELRIKDSLIERSRYVQDSLKVANERLLKLDSLDQEQQDNYYDDFIRERNKNRKYERIIKGIRNRSYTNKHLDSLSTSVIFK